MEQLAERHDAQPSLRQGAPRRDAPTIGATAAVAYLVNQYPKTSHTFIRREIEALERMGVRVERFAIRATRETLVDPADQRELRLTRSILAAGGLTLLGSVVRTAAERPAKFWRAFRQAFSIGRRSHGKFLVHLVYLAEACLLNRWLATARVDHLHAHFCTNPATVAMLCRLLGGPPYSFTAHGTAELDQLDSIAIVEKIQLAKFAVAASDYVRGQLMRRVPHELWSKIHVIRCGISAAYLNAVPTPVPSEPRLLCIGRLSAVKGQLLLLQSLSELQADGVAVDASIIGDGELRTQLEQYATSLDIRHRVTFLGWGDEQAVVRELQRARALVLPSLAEGLPVVIMEALAMSRPVISTQVGGIAELVQPGANGWLAPPGDASALADAIRQMLATDAATLTAMGRRGRELVLARHDPGQESAKLAALFQAH